SHTAGDTGQLPDSWLAELQPFNGDNVLLAVISCTIEGNHQITIGGSSMELRILLPLTMDKSEFSGNQKC
ncbi:MAG: hypothetical protein JAY71_08535, partial [Candidatus Thiodiazotropha weberae]|nr:hypothetical protein [Candidatus Thiodiazotropha weberae]